MVLLRLADIPRPAFVRRSGNEAAARCYGRSTCRSAPRRHAGEVGARKLTALIRVAERFGHPTVQLSGGQQQWVAITRALIGEPSLLLADEPRDARYRHQHGLTTIIDRLPDDRVRSPLWQFDQGIALGMNRQRFHLCLFTLLAASSPT